jgi:hypothetical protein
MEVGLKFRRVSTTGDPEIEKKKIINANWLRYD